MTSTSKQVSSGNQLYWVADNVIADDFPDASRALRDPDGLLAIGGDLSPERILDAYRRGIFPWYSRGQPILWWSPNPRCVLEPNAIRISRSLAKTLRRRAFRVTFNTGFARVLRACAEPRRGQTDTWITPEMAQAYRTLHAQGYAVSVETWHEQRLVGGLYGIAMGRIFFGESMFSRESDASKVALVHLARHLQDSKFRLIDCQVYSRHLQSLGAVPMARGLFINILTHYCSLEPTLNWPRESEFA